jgi:hypothetical protein
VNSTPKDFTETTSKAHIVTPKGIIPGSEVSRESAKTPKRRKREYKPAKNIPQKPIDSIEDARSNDIVSTHVDDDAFTDNAA